MGRKTLPTKRRGENSRCWLASKAARATHVTRQMAPWDRLQAPANVPSAMRGQKLAGGQIQRKRRVQIETAGRCSRRVR